MRLTVLGSGSVFAGGDRARTAYLIEGNKNALVMDLGYGAFMNLKKLVKTEDVNCLLFSHVAHPDHVVDLLAFMDDRQAISRNKGVGKEQVNIVGPKGMNDFFGKLLQLFPLFRPLPFKVKVEEMDYGEKKLFEFTIRSKPVKHVKNSLGYRIESEGRAIAYSGDTAYCQEIIDLGRKADLLVLDCSSAYKKTELHLNATECGEIASEAGAKSVLLGHLGPDAEKADLKALARKKFKGRIYVAKDLMQVSV